MNDIFRKRILAATAGILSMAGTVQAIEMKRSSDGWDGPVGAWTDKSDPLADYGLERLSRVPYRAETDEILSPDAQLAFEQTVVDLKEKSFKKTSEIYQKTILLNALSDAISVTQVERDYTATSREIKEFIADYLKEPDATLARAIDMYSSVTPAEHEDDAVSEDTMPPETQRGVKAFLEHMQLQLKSYDLQIAAMDEAVGAALNLPKHPKKTEIEAVARKLKVIVLDAPALEKAIASYLDGEYGAIAPRGVGI